MAALRAVGRSGNQALKMLVRCFSCMRNARMSCSWFPADAAGPALTTRNNAATAAPIGWRVKFKMRSLRVLGGFQHVKPGWCGAPRPVIDLVERRAILGALRVPAMQGPRRVMVLSCVFVAAAGLGRELHACDGKDPAAWARSHQELRSTKGHFSGGNWSPAVDAWGGAKHRLMQCLAAHATAASLRAAPLRQLMGPPDERLACPSAACSEVLEKLEWQPAAAAVADPAELWLYHWRGRHDRLVLAFAQGVVRSHG